MLPQITTERLVLRELAPSDADAFYKAFYHSDFADAMLADSCRDRYFAEEYIRSALNDGDRGSIWAVTDKKSGCVLGSVSLSTPQNNGSETGYWISDEYKGQGFATEAVCAVLSYARTHLKLHRVWARCRIDNLASLRVLKKSGFRLEGIARDEVFRRGSYVSIAYLAVIYDNNV